MHEPVVTFIAPIYKQRPILGYSLLEQLYPHWRLVLVHDGPDGSECMDELPDDSRIEKVVFEANTGNRWGHPIRQFGLSLLKYSLNQSGNPPSNVVITNGDNYHCPGFCKYLVDALEKNPKHVAAYCEYLCHNYQEWRLIPVQLEMGFIDPCAVMVRSEVACEIGWRRVDERSDWFYIRDIIKAFGEEKFIKVSGMHVVHN